MQSLLTGSFEEEDGQADARGAGTACVSRYNGVPLIAVGMAGLADTAELIGTEVVATGSSSSP